MTTYPPPGPPLMGQGLPYLTRPGQEPPQHDPWMNDLRSQIADAAQIFSAKQAMLAWDRRRSDPLAPHGIAMFWADLVEHQVGDRLVPRYRLHTGRRLFPDDPEARNKTGLLYDLLQLAQADHDQGTWWPHITMLNRCDPLERHYWYAGFAVSSLDAEDGPWSEVADTAPSPMHVPTIIHIGLSDGSRMVCRRLGRQRLDRYEIRSSASLDYTPGQPIRVYQWDIELADERDDLWDLIGAFNQLIGGVYSGRPQRPTP